MTCSAVGAHIQGVTSEEAADGIVLAVIDKFDILTRGTARTV